MISSFPRATLFHRLVQSALCLPQFLFDFLSFLLREEQIARQALTTNATEHVAPTVNHRTAEWTFGAHQTLAGSVPLSLLLITESLTKERIQRWAPKVQQKA
jgi:hypothetical protein